ncbi:MAG: RsmB/NOP family class I SAM-dependent RNA methyltransferase [Gemmatimonadales bacterium]|nr:MAG: RsmB/NOP family class I SAM-dependent RNA methyltransferase [Gemmatimonadales bacterium]
MTGTPFHRYRSFIPPREWQAFTEALARPEPRTFRIRGARVDPSDLAHGLETQGFEVSRFPGLPDVFRIHREPFPLSETLEHWLGLLYMQQAATTLAAPMLAPRPGESVLDLCAAPGGKTSHLAELMDDRGCLVAVDLSEKRVQALAGNLSRLAHPAAITVVGDALDLPEQPRFHRVLADVPCSGEGRSRGGVIHQASEGDLRRLPVLQEALLRKALRMTVPGGRVLYVTCTLAPEENEAVVDAVLRETGQGAGGSPPARLLPLTPDIPHAPGLTRFGELRFAPELAGTVRIHPHHLDSGGLFLALLERRDDGSGGESPGDSPSPPWEEGWTRPGPVLPGETASVDLSSALTALSAELATDPLKPAGRGAGESEVDGEGSFGLGGEIGWIERAGALRFHRLTRWPLDEWARSGALRQGGKGGRGRVMTVGLRGAELPRGFRPPRPTGDLLRFLAPQLRKTGLELDEDEWIHLLAGAALPAGDEPSRILLYRGEPLTTARRKGRRLIHDMPPARAGWLRQVMERRRS